MDAVTLTPNLGELCPGQDVVLTCSTTEGSTMGWIYNEMVNIGDGFLIPFDAINTTQDDVVSGFMFSAVLTSQTPFVSKLSFRADAAMNGHNVSCRVGISLSGGGVNLVDTAQTLQIAQIGSFWFMVI